VTVRRLPLTVVVFVLACGRGAEPELQVVPNAAPQQMGGATAPATVTSNALDQRTAELFGDAMRLDAALPVTLDSVEVAGGDDSPAFDLDVRSFETYDRVRHYVSIFSGPAKGRIEDRLSDGTRYEAMIRSKLRAGSLPEDMYYLALVESGYNPHAYSRAAAVGMWQFMSTTARGMGLRVDWWIDERRDPVRSTDAAVRFLRGLNEQFGSMYLAAAAYNGGPGRIARGLNRYADDLEGSNPDEMFFTLAEKKYLRGETSNYVPQLIAVALVAKEASRHGLAITQREPFAYDSVWVRGEVPLTAIAKASGASLVEIQELNSHILRGMTPPLKGRDSMKVRVPVGKAARFDSAFATLDSADLDAVRTIRAEKNATWSTIARKHKIPAKALPLYNPKVKPAKGSGRIPAGTVVLVPAPQVYAAALSVPDPSIEKYGTGTRTHVVRQGENLSVIAKRYRTTSAAIMRLNRLKKPMIFPGQELLVNGSPAPAKKKATAQKR
jgi:membrane-bound lytic murein transglycosylase D